ncbi:MAG: PocR ligand-binding domain-containing protein [Magnetococcales bacterium]|nr:PocR ligand-binding domain-containing protein [Magnetococcales bacterium]
MSTDKQEKLEQIEWLLEKIVKPEVDDREGYEPPYGNLTELNTQRVILDAVGENILGNIANDYLDLLETSGAIYETNGDYALGIFSSGWCQFMDRSSWNLCQTSDNQTALNSGKWLCHESCWLEASKASIDSAQPVDIECAGGIHLYAVPIMSGGKIVGSMNVGYGDPPTDPDKLAELAAEYQVDFKELESVAKAYRSRPQFIIEIAKKRLQSSAKLVGEMIQRSQMEKELRRQREELNKQALALAAANKELKSFTYSVSHDLRAPLRKLEGFCQILMDEHLEDLPGQAVHYLERIQYVSQHMSQLVNDLLRLSRISQEEVTIETFDISAMVSAIAIQLEEESPEREIVWEITPRLFANGDRRLMEIVLGNLLGNAWKFTKHEDMAKIKFGVTTHKDQKVFLIKDNGVGFDMEYADKLFMPFKRLHSVEEFEGTGIGLATVRRIIHRLGGEIWAEAQEGQGAAFYFTLGNL